MDATSIESDLSRHRVCSRGSEIGHTESESVALYCTYCTYARTVLTYRIDLSYTYCTYIPYSYSPSRILNPDTVYVDASQLQATSFTFLANVVSFAFISLLTYLVTNTSSFSALQPLARPSPQY